MEPMTLGSPSGSPATYLPSFLMGEQQAPTTPRSNTLSPNKAIAGRSLSFVTSPAASSPPDYNRSMLGQKPLSHNSSISGPPTQGLFDALRNERNQVQTPPRGMTPQANYGTPMPPQNLSAFGINQSYQQQTQPSIQTAAYNDSYLSTASFNTSRAMLSPLGPSANYTPTTAFNNISNGMQQYAAAPYSSEFWITVYGFPPSATTSILQHFAQCGTIVEKVFPPQNGNWVHIKYSSRLECDKALNYNEKILANNIMIGVTQCKDRNIVDKENLCDSATQQCKIRPLAQTAYKSVQNDSAVVASPCAPQKSSGLMNKAMDLFFGW